MQKLTQRLTIAVFALVLLSFMVLHLLLPDGTISRAERRKLQQFPAVSSEALLSAEFSEDVEDYLLDQFPFRDSFRTLKAVWTYDLLGQKDNNGIYIAEGTASKLDATLDEKQLKLFTDKMNSLHETYFPNANVYCAVIPDKNYYRAPSHGYPTLDYESKQGYAAEFEGLRGMFTVVGCALAFVIGLVGVLNFLNAILTGIITRRREFAVLQAVGMTGRQLKTMLIFEGLGYTLLALLLALAVSAAAGPLVGPAVEKLFWFFTYRFTAAPLLALLPVFLLLGCVVPLASYRAAARQTVVERLRAAD